MARKFHCKRAAYMLFLGLTTCYIAFVIATWGHFVISKESNPMITTICFLFLALPGLDIVRKLAKGLPPAEKPRIAGEDNAPLAETRKDEAVPEEDA
jgi:hypothetical protein